MFNSSGEYEGFTTTPDGGECVMSAPALLHNDGTVWSVEDEIVGDEIPPNYHIINTDLYNNDYNIFKSSVNINSYLDYVILEELRMNPNGYKNVNCTTGGGLYDFGPLNFENEYIDAVNNFIGGYSINQCQGEEYKVSAISNDSQGWMFDNVDTNLSDQLKGFVINASMSDELTGGGVERTDDVVEEVIPENFVKDLVLRWNDLRGDVLSDERVLYRIDYYYYYLNDRSVMNYNLSGYQSMTFDDNINNLRNWVMDRIYWIDHNIRRMKYQINDDNSICKENPLKPEGIIKFSENAFCNDIDADNYYENSNFNDGTCNYVLNRELQFQINTQNVGYPKIDLVKLNILTKNGFDVNESYDMVETIENIWSYDLFDFLPGDIFTYNYTKETPDVYNVRTGALETDKVRTFQVRDEHQIEIKDTFNDFVNEFEESNLPIIKINTNTFNDMGFVDDNNPNLFYCPSYLLESGYFADGPPESMCDMMKDYIGWFKDDYDGDNPGGYYETKKECQTQTGCVVDCIDGTNIQDEPKIAGYVEIIYNGEGAINNINDEPQLGTRIGIEARGYSSRGFAKKQYAVELQDMTKIFPQCDDKSASFSLFCNGFTPKEGIDYGDECVFNMENDFVFLGPFRDRTYMRNAITYELWDRMGNIGTNSKFFEFVMNDVYMGLYAMFEKPKIDDLRVPIDKEIHKTDPDIEIEDVCIDDSDCEEDFICVNYPYSIDGVDYSYSFCTEANGHDFYDGGWMVKVESGAEQDFFIGYDGYTKFEYYDPSLELKEGVDLRQLVECKDDSELDGNLYDTLIECLQSNCGDCDDEDLRDVVKDNAVITMAKGEVSSQVKEFEMRVIDDFDLTEVEEVAHIPDFVDYWLIQEFARNNEGFTRSQYWHSFGNASEYGPFDSEEEPIYDDNKIYISYVWDMNHSFAATIVNYDGWATQNFFAVPEVWRSLFLKDWFQEQVYERYVELKNNLPVFNVIEINKLIDKFSNEMLSYNAVNRDQKRWFDGDINDFNIYVKNLRKYILQRISWMDLHICSGSGTPFISSDSDNALFSITTFDICPEDEKNSDFTAIYSPYEGQIFSINEVGNSFEIEMVISLNLNSAEYLNNLEVVITDANTGIEVHKFSGDDILVDSSGYLRLTWNTFVRKNQGLLIGDYTITSTVVDYDLSLEENQKNFSIRRIDITSGCIDPNAINYNLFAEVDDGSCKYQQDCNLKYNISEFITDIVELYPGYNTISYPLDFSGIDIDLFAILDNSYYNNAGVKGGFEQHDFVTAFFNDVVYTATYMDGKWIPSTNRGFSLNEVSKGIGFILHVADGGRIIWDIPRRELL